MATCVYTAYSTESLFEYNHRFYEENGNLMSVSFEFVTMDGIKFNYLWKIKYTLSSRIAFDSETDEDSVNFNILYSIELKVEEKFVADPAIMSPTKGSIEGSTITTNYWKTSAK